MTSLLYQLNQPVNGEALPDLEIYSAIYQKLVEEDLFSAQVLQEDDGNDQKAHLRLFSEDFASRIFLE